MTKQIEHVFIPDTQVKPGVPTDHIEAAGNYIADRKPDKIIIAGDWWDMYSLNSYDMGKKAHEGARYRDDIQSGIDAMDRFFRGIKRSNKRNRRQHLALYKPEVHFLIGNHEQRILRHVEAYPYLEGKLSFEDFKLRDKNIIIHDFLDVAVLDGIVYSHYFPRGPNGQVNQQYRGAPSAAAQVKREMQSCTAGHARGLDVHFQTTFSGIKIGLIAGSFYMHEEEYVSPQGNVHWNGIVYKHRVKNGSYDPMFVSLDYLLENWL